MVITKIKNKMMLNFDETKRVIKTIDVPAQRLGIFNVRINNMGRKYYFEKLKENYNDDDCLGFGLNHYGWLGLAGQNYKRSKFHDIEDVSIDINRVDFINCIKLGNQLTIKTKTFKAVVNW